MVAAKSGTAMPSGKYPIRSKHELRSAIKLRHHSTEPYGAVRAHIQNRASALKVKITPAMLASGSYEEFGKPKGAYGRSSSLKWPWLYDKLVAKGYDHSKAAAIANSRVKFRQHGRLNVLNAKDAHNPKVQAKILSADKAGKHMTSTQLTGSKRKRVVLASATVVELYNQYHSKSDGRFTSGTSPKA